MPTTWVENESFLREKERLEYLGVKNNDFHLKVSNPSVKEIDPFDPNISKWDQGIVASEAIINPWYFLGHCMKIHSFATDKSEPFKLNATSMAMIYAYMKGYSSQVQTPRQMFRTFTASALMVWDMVRHNLNPELERQAIIHCDPVQGKRVIDGFKDGTMIPDFLSEMFQEGLIPRTEKDGSKAKTLYHPRDSVRTPLRIWRPSPSKPETMVIYETPTHQPNAVRANAATWVDNLYDLTDEELRLFVDLFSRSDALHVQSFFIQHSAADLGIGAEYHMNAFRMLNQNEAHIDIEVFGIRR